MKLFRRQRPSLRAMETFGRGRGAVTNGWPQSFSRQTRKRCVGPQHTGHFGLHASVERTEARKHLDVNSPPHVGPERANSCLYRDTTVAFQMRGNKILFTRAIANTRLSRTTLIVPKDV